MFIHYIHLLYLSYMFRCYIHHHQGELLCPLLKTRYCYKVVNYDFFSSYAINYKVQLCIYTGVIKYTVVKITDVASQCYLLKTWIICG